MNYDTATFSSRLGADMTSDDEHKALVFTERIIKKPRQQYSNLPADLKNTPKGKEEKTVIPTQPINPTGELYSEKYCSDCNEHGHTHSTVWCSQYTRGGQHQKDHKNSGSGSASESNEDYATNLQFDSQVKKTSYSAKFQAMPD